MIADVPYKARFCLLAAAICSVVIGCASSPLTAAAYGIGGFSVFMVGYYCFSDELENKLIDMEYDFINNNR